MQTKCQITEVQSLGYRLMRISGFLFYAIYLKKITIRHELKIYRWCHTRVDGEFQLGFLSIIHGQSFHQQRGESRSRTATERMEYQEPLKTRTLIGEFPYSVEHLVDQLLTDSVVTSGVIVGSIFFSGDKLLGVEELTVCARSYLIWGKQKNEV